MKIGNGATVIVMSNADPQTTANVRQQMADAMKRAREKQAQNGAKVTR